MLKWDMATFSHRPFKILEAFGSTRVESVRGQKGEAGDNRGQETTPTILRTPHSAHTDSAD